MEQAVSYLVYAISEVFLLSAAIQPNADDGFLDCRVCFQPGTDALGVRFCSCTPEAMFVQTDTEPLVESRRIDGLTMRFKSSCQ